MWEIVRRQHADGSFEVRVSLAHLSLLDRVRKRQHAHTLSFAAHWEEANCAAGQRCIIQMWFVRLATLRVFVFDRFALMLNCYILTK